MHITKTTAGILVTLTAVLLLFCVPAASAATLATALGTERPSQPVTSVRLCKVSNSGCAFENPDGSPITIGTDYFGKPRNAANPTPGPFEAPETGTVTLKVWPLTVGKKVKEPN